jgi:hypothetical protein
MPGNMLVIFRTGISIEQNSGTGVSPVSLLPFKAEQKHTGGTPVPLRYFPAM